jgi:glycosyltransferase involved in cell wall biosynthesis
MNVLFLSELYFPHGSGAELATHLHAKFLADTGFNVVVVTNRFDGEDQSSRNGNLEIHRLPLLKGDSSVKYSILQRFDVLFSSSLRNLIKWADVVYVPRFWYSAIPVAKAYGKPVITHLHDYIAICPLSNNFDMHKETVCDKHDFLCSPRCIYAFEKARGRSSKETLASMILNSGLGRYLPWLIGLSDAVICASRAQREQIIARYPSWCNKIHVIYNPLPKLPYIPLEGDDFAYFGGPSKLKGFHVLYRALEKIDRKVTVRATCFGDRDIIHLPNGPTIQEYERVQGEPLHSIYCKTKAVIFPSICAEPAPYVIYEALLRGRIIIASHTGGIPEQLDKCPGSFLFSPGDYVELADFIDHVSSMGRTAATELGVQNRNNLLVRYQNGKGQASLSRMINDLS